jgi:sulfite reductase alpha subunit-like flavoprotein
MGEGVHQALTDILGQSMLEALQLQQRYIRDVY